MNPATRGLDLAFVVLVVAVGVATFVVDDPRVTLAIAGGGLVVGLVLAVLRWRAERARRRDGD